MPLELEKLCYLPLALPLHPIDRGRLLEFWEQHARPVVRDKKCEHQCRDPEAQEFCCVRVANWRALDVLGRADNFTPPFVDIEDYFPGFFAWILEHLPFRKLHHVYLWENLRKISPHRDFESSPPTHLCGGPHLFRILLHDENPQSTLFLMDEESKAKVYLPRPQETDCFVMSNHLCAHGAAFRGKRKILVLIAGEIDSERYLELLKRSWRQFSDYAVLKQGQKLGIYQPEPELSSSLI